MDRRTVTDLLFDYWRGAADDVAPAELTHQARLLEAFVLPHLGDQRGDQLHAGQLVDLTRWLISSIGVDQTGAVLDAFREVLVFAGVDPPCPRCGGPVRAAGIGSVGCSRCGWTKRVHE